MKTETKVTHTPGPWRYLPMDGDSVIRGPKNSDNSSILVCVMGESEYATGDAHLIAAAPDMLEALQAIEELATRQIQGGTPEQCHTQLAQLRGLIHRTAQAVIAKAKGGAA